MLITPYTVNKCIYVTNISVYVNKFLEVDCNYVIHIDILFVKNLTLWTVSCFFASGIYLWYPKLSYKLRDFSGKSLRIFKTFANFAEKQKCLIFEAPLQWTNVAYKNIRKVLGVTSRYIPEAKKQFLIWKIRQLFYG